MRVRPSANAAIILAGSVALVGCGGSSRQNPDYLEPPRPMEPLDGEYVFDAEVPVYGSIGGYEPVQGSAKFSATQFQLTSTHGSCGGELRESQPGRYRLSCQGIELELEWIGARWGGRMLVQVMESSEEQICVSRNAQGGCAQFRTERNERPARRSADFALYRPGEAR